MSVDLIRDLHLVRDAERNELAQRAREVLQAWAQAWLPETSGWSPSLDVSCSTEGSIDASPDGWQAFGPSVSKSATAWAQVSDVAKGRLAAILVARESTAPLAETDWAVQSAVVALDDLNARLLGACLPDATVQPDLKALSGVIVAREKTLGLVWAWSRAAYASAPRASDKTNTLVAPLTSGLGQQNVQVGAGLGEVDIPMADLLSLQIGDVIRFPALLDGPVPLLIGTPGELKQAAQVQLGQRDGHVAVKLVSKHSVA